MYISDCCNLYKFISDYCNVDQIFISHYCNIDAVYISDCCTRLSLGNDGADTSASAGASPATPTEIFLPVKVLRFP